MNFSISKENVSGILMEIALYLWITLSSMNLLTIFSLQIREYCMSLYLFGSLISSVFGSLVANSLARFIPKYFLLFDAIINGIIL